ncbi:MAG: hypothetical protein J5I47_03165 [Vicingus serpentipes]|nr:hypothetical protein [Vicingus serpentipes]
MFDNPFSIDRAEQLGDELFKFFAYHEKFDGLLKRKSLMVQGGRGSGKTMFFLYHTYGSKKNESTNSGTAYNEFLKNLDLFGIYYRCDSNFVPGFQHKGIDEYDWEQLFAHYLNVTLSKELVEIVIDINKNTNNALDFFIADEISELLGEPITDFIALYKKLKKEEIKVINYVNNVGRVEKPLLINNGLLINLISKNILNQDILKGKTIHIFIDEYENLLMYQQKLINTLIKHPNPVILDIGSRNEGVKTYDTLAAEETIRSPHDYNYFNFEDFTNEEHEELINEICKKRLQRVEEFREIDSSNDFLDIKFYLGKENIYDEISNVFSSKKELYKLITRYKNILKDYKDIDINGLISIEEPFLLRLIIVLVERGNNIKEINDEYIKYNQGESSKFKDWIHNNKNGLVYLVCKESSIKKQYYGYNTYVALSSGIIRFFIELCEAAFKNASRNGFNFNDPRVLSKEEQSSAAFYVSRYKINDVDTYSPYSKELKQFTLLLGGVFEKLHRDKKLSEPEQNHFSTNYDKLTNNSKLFLKTSVLYSVLQKRHETKDKSDSIDSNNYEYHLNHIYAPYFEISPRRIRKIQIPEYIFDSLISNDTSKAENAANSLINKKNTDTNQLRLNDLF